VEALKSCRRHLFSFSRLIHLSDVVGVVDFAIDIAQPLGRLFGGQVTLSLAQQLEADHELSDRCGPQQRRVVDGVQRPMAGIVVPQRTGRGAMESHRIGERTLEQVVVFGGQLFDDDRQIVDLDLGQVVDSFVGVA
jgi:hypothetical protein